MVSKIKEFILLTVGILIMVGGIYFFKFPNNFSFGGVTGIAIVVSEYLPVSRGVITTIINVALLIIGFLLLGKGFGIKTVYTLSLIHISKARSFGSRSCVHLYSSILFTEKQSRNTLPKLLAFVRKN